MTDTQRILDVLESNGTPLSRRDLLRLAGESGIALAGLALLAGARPEPAAAQSGGTMRIHMATDIQQLDPHLVTAWNDYCPWESMFSSLTALDRDFQPVPDLAQSWTQPDPKTYVFQLRKGVLFHSGREMKAADVKFSLERIQSLGGRSKWFTLILDLDKVEVRRRLPGAAPPQAAVGAVPGQPRLRDDRGPGERREDRPRADRDGAVPLRGARAELPPARPPLGQVLRARSAEGGRDPVGAGGGAGRRASPISGPGPPTSSARCLTRRWPSCAARRASRSTIRRPRRPTPSSC